MSSPSVPGEAEMPDSFDPAHTWEGADDSGDEGASQVRPYTLTSGRTRSTIELPMEATLGRLPESPDQPELDPPHTRIIQLCQNNPSVAELSAATDTPLGVVRVLISDLVESGFLQVQATLGSDAPASERHDLIERTLRGLQAI